ncbi:MAG: hypothetical protein V4615_03815, partial [Bacteroidota bacterium]
MKRIFFVTAISISALLYSSTTQAQAWDKSSKVLSLGLGASSFFHIYDGAPYGTGWGLSRRGFYTPITGQLNFQGEFGVHKYVGVGFTTGIGGAGSYYGWSGEMNIPIGVIANFHFYQLIDDKVSADIHSDKLDVYGGLNIGSGVAFFFDGGSTVVPIAFGGVQVGARYY